MHRQLLPLLLLTAAGCGPSLDVVEVALSDLPNPSLQVELEPAEGGEFVASPLEQDNFNGPCHRLSSKTRMTANGRALTVGNLGDYGTETFPRSYASCITPHFKGPTLPDEPRTEFILSDGQSQRRAVFQQLRTPRHFRVNGQEQPTVRSGQELDIEWFPATDDILGVEVYLKQEGGTGYVQTDTYRTQGNHIHVKFSPTPAGRYVLTAMGTAKVGVEACEGFSTCEAPLLLYSPNDISLPVTLEAP
jgi:hypothetical protein